ncbi:MAG: fructose-6-phosphate aldolase [Rhodospirillaceae bacterium]|nr:fructose-6-phosphate aldolase [Rhodospirillaceae bacterium]|tara:strand:+ start:1336 stop:1995 length:660 start_codon:yes stop_codon:yes gene_type:complete
MEFFIDTADVNEIAELVETGLVDGVTTNPSLIAKTGHSYQATLGAICDLVKGPVSAEVTALEPEDMLQEGRHLSKISDNIVVKVPLTWNGLRACKMLRDEAIHVNVTLCFSASQALLAAKVGATYISPFVGRLDDIGQNGMELIRAISEIYEQHKHSLQTKILVASVRSPLHVVEAARLGAQVITVPAKVLKQMAEHPLTDKGLDAFLKDWAITGQSIL